MLTNSIWVFANSKIQNILMQYKKEIQHFDKDNFIYMQEDPRDYLYFLNKGRVRISIINSDGSEKTLAIHEPGSFFGETAFFDKYSSFSCAQALEDSTVLVFGRDEVTKLMHENPEIMSHLIESMARKIRLLSFQVESLSFMKTEERLVSLLITFFASFGKKCPNSTNSKKGYCKFKDFCPDGHILDLKITDQEIGNMIGARREAVTIAINNLRDQGLIQKESRTICCPDLAKLNKLLLK